MTEITPTPKRRKVENNEISPFENVPVAVSQNITSKFNRQEPAFNFGHLSIQCGNFSTKIGRAIAKNTTRRGQANSRLSGQGTKKRQG